MLFRISISTNAADKLLLVEKNHKKHKAESGDAPDKPMKLVKKRKPIRWMLKNK